MPSVLDDFRLAAERLISRIRELESSVAELDELRAVAAQLDLDISDELGDTPAGSRSRTRLPNGQRARRSSGGTPVRLTRRDRVLELVGQNPGISVSELVDVMNVNRTSLYPVVRQLVSDGLVEKSHTHLTLVARDDTAVPPSGQA
jgi:hypothetical protein